MSTAYFDTLQYAKALVKAGFTERQAETLVEEQSKLVRKDLVTKSYLDQEVKLLEQRLTIKLGGMITIAVAVVAVLVRLL
jgi:primosomal protein N''